uniref:Centromere protein U n=1 Tax=Gasterosteus aculeatus aculeatus TaxID=481459 RepID=A0AAQ4RYN3_GASAC|nr:centromere protein U [Gasterosteus aculeatus aculeatus]
MSAKKGRRAKVLSVTQQKGSPNDRTDSPNLSSIERGSFLEGLQQAYGNPLHSTALEEDLSVPEEGQTNRGKAGRKEITQTGKSAVKERGAAAKRKEAERNGENEEEQEKKKRSRRSTTGARPVENQQMKSENSESETERGKPGDAAPQARKRVEESHTGRKRVLSSSEGEDGDESWNPSPKKAKVLNLARSRKLSSNKSKPTTSSSEPDKPNRDEQRKKRRAGGGTETEVVLDAFLDFCDQYRESVESKAVKQAVDSFSSNVEEQLLEKISTSRELKVLKKENAKVASSIHTKKRRLLDAKHELMRAERAAWLLQKEKAELKVQLADLRRGQAFLRDFRELNRLYLDHRRKRPKEKETYGAASLPALLLETKQVRTAEHQL